MEDQEIIAMYQTGKSCEEIAKHYGVTSQCISKRLRKLEVVTRKVAGYYTPEELQELRSAIANLRAKDLTIAEIGEIVGLSHTSVWYHLKATELC